MSITPIEAKLPNEPYLIKWAEVFGNSVLVEDRFKRTIPVRDGFSHEIGHSHPFGISRVVSKYNLAGAA